MGLDMYLTAERYVSDWDEKDKELVNQLAKLPINRKIGRIKSLTVDVMYWRKVNAIHEWFVQNKQDGVDECQKTWLSIDDLKELLAVCKQVYDDRSLADELLPTQDGFFFGDTEYTDYYFDSIKETIDRLEEVFSQPEDELNKWDFHYQSSW
jgi:hypothetical protein